MFKYIAKQLEPGTEDFSWVFDDDGLRPSSGSFNNTLFIFTGNECWFNDDIYSEYESILNYVFQCYCYLCTYGLDDIEEIEEIDDLAFDYLCDYSPYDSFAFYPEFVEYLGFSTDNKIIRLLDSCVYSISNDDYPEALVAYLQAKTGTMWNTRNFSGYSQGDYCTLVYCETAYDSAALDYYGNMWLGCGGEFAVGTLDIPDEQDTEIDLSDLESFEHLVDDWTYGYFVVDDILWRGGDRLISELADLADCSAKDLEVYVYENGEYINTRDQ